VESENRMSYTPNSLLDLAIAAEAEVRRRPVQLLDQKLALLNRVEDALDCAIALENRGNATVTSIGPFGGTTLAVGDLVKIAIGTPVTSITGKTFHKIAEASYRVRVLRVRHGRVLRRPGRQPVIVNELIVWNGKKDFHAVEATRASRATSTVADHDLVVAA
jgi:hypothetical protein